VSQSISFMSLIPILSEHPWAAIVFIFVAGVVLPAVWSRKRRRRVAALTVLIAILNATIRAAEEIRRTLR
jgi:uncharacterized membrane protein